MMKEKVKKSIEILHYSLWVNLLGKWPDLQHALRVFFKEGPGRPLLENKHLSFLWVGENSYSEWLSRNRLTETKREELKKEASQLPKQPKISIIMPVYNVNKNLLQLGIDSVKKQLYGNWELCIVDDCSTNPETVHFLNTIEHDRIKIRYLEKNQGIAVASNEAIAMTTGEYVALLDHDDEITEEALLDVVKCILAEDPDFIYSDEDKLDQQGNRVQPFFKPDWSPDLLRCQNYICHLTVIKKSILEAVNGFREGFEGAQDHDLFLRISEQTDNISHIPKILYSWRKSDTSTASSPDSKPYAQEAGLKAINEHLKRVFKNGGFAQRGPYLFVHDARFPVNPKPLVSIIIPTKDNLRYLKNCVNSILIQSDYPNYEIIILDNNSEKKETKNWFKEIANSHGNIKVLDAFYPFCWSKLNNHGISEANGDVYIFLNNDTEVISRNWMGKLAEQALRDDVGAAGPLLLYQDRTIQHAGVVVGMGGWADHVFKGMREEHFFSPYLSPMVRRNVLAVTGSCLVMSKESIDAIGGFNERFTVCGSDVEICLRAHEKGLYNIFDPFVKLFHYESKTRQPHNIPSGDFEMSKLYYHKYLKNGDPYYNINLSLSNTTPMLAEA